MNIPARTFHIQTFGCQMNASDSEWLVRSLKARGFAEAPFEEAAFYLLNTCSVRGKAEQKVYSELGRIARFCKVNQRRNVTVCVGGCVAQQAGDRIMKRFPEVRLVFGTDGIARAPEAVSRLAEEPRLRLKLLDFTERYVERDDTRLCPAGVEADGSPDIPRPHPDIPACAFVNIMQGCDNYCAYCIVPYVRGAQKSRDAGAVLAECRALAAGGAREITLLGQNVNSYGLDKNGKAEGAPPFAQLLRSVAAIPGLERLRFVTSHPKDIAPEVIDAFARLENLCPRLHLPLQSGSDRILKAMNRRYDVARYMDIALRLKKARPDILLTTDIIVGFPGETEADFQETMRVMREVGFASSFSFVYSDRPGARAVLLPGKIERSIALERLSRLQAWQNQANDSILASMVGEKSVILIEGKSRLDALLAEDGGADGDGGTARNAAAPSHGVIGEAEAGYESWQGKTPQGLIVNVELPRRSDRGRLEWPGAMVPVVIDAAARHSLKGRQAGAPW